MGSLGGSVAVRSVGRVGVGRVGVSRVGVGRLMMLLGFVSVVSAIGSSGVSVLSTGVRVVGVGGGWLHVLLVPLVHAGHGSAGGRFASGVVNAGGVSGRVTGGVTDRVTGGVGCSDVAVGYTRFSLGVVGIGGSNSVLSLSGAVGVGGGFAERGRKGDGGEEGEGDDFG